jgi:hypothetical protein
MGIAPTNRLHMGRMVREVGDPRESTRSAQRIHRDRLIGSDGGETGLGSDPSTRHGTCMYIPNIFHVWRKNFLANIKISFHHV